jgi:Protein of unknown function (DUF3141)
VSGEWLMRCEPRTLEDIRALGGNDAADERMFGTAARVSQTNLALYRTFAQPAVRTLMNSQFAEWLQQLHPLRLQYTVFSDENPFMAHIAALADQVRKDRKPAAIDNPFLSLQQSASRQIVNAFDRLRDANEALAERTFLSIYGSPTLQVGMGIDLESTKPLRKAGKSPLHKHFMEYRIAELRSQFGNGGLRASVVRSALYVGMSHGSFDERSFELIRRIRLVPDGMPRLTLVEFKALVREQYFMLLIDEEAALAAIPSLLPASAEERQQALAVLREMLSVRGEVTGEAADRLKRIVRLFDVEERSGDMARIGEARTGDKRRTMAS